MQKLNLPEYNFRIKSVNGSPYILDTIRSKFIFLTPEEWVRQNFIKYLIKEKDFPASLLSVETELKLNGMSRRTDILTHDKNGKPNLIVECKRPSVKISQATFDQITRYNIVYKVNYLIVTNGLNHYCCFVDNEKNEVSFLKDIPNYKHITT